MGLNHRPAVYETAALPLSYAGQIRDKELRPNMFVETTPFGVWERLYLSSLGNVNSSDRPYLPLMGPWEKNAHPLTLSLLENR